MPVESRANRECVRFLTNALQTFNFQLNIVCRYKAKHKTVLIDMPNHFCWQKLLKNEFAP